MEVEGKQRLGGSQAPTIGELVAVALEGLGSISLVLEADESKAVVAGAAHFHNGAAEDGAQVVVCTARGRQQPTAKPMRTRGAVSGQISGGRKP